MNHIIRFF